MSWFDTSSFATLAKTALKEAQKTIDKALDIKDEDQQKTTVSASTSADFLNKSDDLSASQKQQNTSIWGSFTGSYFENREGNMTAVTAPSNESFQVSNENVDKTLLTSSKSLPDCMLKNVDDLNNSSVISEYEKPEESSVKDESQMQSSSSKLQELPSHSILSSKATEQSYIPHNLELNKNVNATTKKRNGGGNVDHSSNRLSIMSTESDKKSSESVEILSMQSGTNTDCSNTPDSDVTSLSTSVGQKVNSESVEVLPDSLTSPSSVEVIGEWKSDDSPNASPMEEGPLEASVRLPEETLSTPALNESLDSDDIKSSTSTLVGSQPRSSFSSRSRDASGEADEADEASLADDSYASASESTVLETLQDGAEFHETLSKSTSSLGYPLDKISDPTKEKSQVSLHATMEAITCPFEHLKSSMIEPSDTKLKNNQSLEQSGSSEQYTMLTDSSCEETLIDSSSDDNVANVANVKGVHKPLTSSSYIKCMLAEAMADKSESETEKESVVREISPLSSERSDLVKIGSDQTSGHTSGDEVETTTSSDIEIISRYSPNGDSSSNQSRQSPARVISGISIKSKDLLTRTLKSRGHSRELSEISVGSDDANFEVEKLLRRIKEMTEIIEARESKLIEVSRANMELHEANSNMRKQLDNIEKHAENNQDITQLTDDYTQRLSALERGFQQAIRERDSFRKSLELMKQEAASANEVSSISAEKDEMIKELRVEGEKLSKQQLQHCNIIKKLRAKEKESDAQIKSQREQLKEQSTELERLKRSLHAKEEVERSQIEAVHTLTAKCKKQEKEILSLTEQLDHVTNKMEVHKKSLDAAKMELMETKEKLVEAEMHLKGVLGNVRESYQLEAQVKELKIKLQEAETTFAKKEELLRLETRDMLKRVEAAESRKEEMAQSLAEATLPLLRQIEQLQLSVSHKTNVFLRQEESMRDKIADLQAKLENSSEMNRSLAEENANLKSRCSVLENKILSKENEVKKTNDEQNANNKKLSEENEVHKKAMKMLEESHATEIKELKREITSLENKLSIEKAATEAEKRKNATFDHNISIDELQYSPTLSIERESVCSTNSIWQNFNDSVFETSSSRFPNICSTNSSSMMENFQALLKQREGEVQQLQWELSRRNSERDTLRTELSTLSISVEDLQQKVVEMEQIRESLKDIQTKYDALLQMYGEKVEENEELRLDLEDVKEVYKTQIDQLLKRDQ